MTRASQRRERLSAADARRRREQYEAAEARRQAYHDDLKIAAAEVAAGKVTTCTALITGRPAYRGYALGKVAPGQQVSIPNSLVGTFKAAGIVSVP